MNPLNASSKTLIAVRLSVALLSLAGLSVGCGGSGPERAKAPDLALFDAVSCPSGFAQRMVQGLTPAAAVDYVELRHFSTLYVADPPGSYHVVGTLGAKCATAKDRMKCEAELAMLNSNAGFRFTSIPGVSERFALATTRRDAVQLVVTEDALMRFLTPIDTPEEAILAVWLSYQAVLCDDKEGGAVRAVLDGYEVLSVHANGDRFEDVLRSLWKVDHSGNLTKLWSGMYWESYH